MSRFVEPAARRDAASVPANRPSKGRAHSNDAAPAAVTLVDLKGALTSAPKAKSNSLVHLQSSSDERGMFVDVRLYLNEPKVSPSSKTFSCGWGQIDAGEVKVSTSAYITIPKEDRYRYADLAAAARAERDAKGRKTDEDDQ